MWIELHYDPCVLVRNLFCSANQYESWHPELFWEVYLHDGGFLQEDSLKLEDWGQEGYGATGLYEFLHGKRYAFDTRPFFFMVKSWSNSEDPTSSLLIDSTLKIIHDLTSLLYLC